MQQFIDLTQTIQPGIPDWDGCCGFSIVNVVDYPEGLRAQVIKTPSGIGTHMDAPCHFIEGQADISALSLHHLIGTGVVIDISNRIAADSEITKDDIVDHETQHGIIPNQSIVIGKTGWGQYWEDPTAYRNVDADGLMRFPKFSALAVEYLLTKNINGIAIDTLSPDGEDHGFPVHHQLLGAGKFIIENIHCPDNLPVRGFTIYALPVKIKNGTEAPCRVIAVLD